MLIITTRVGKNTNDIKIGMMVSRLLMEANERELQERRADVRHPFFASVSIRLLDGSNQQFSAFSREISAGGIGLLHNFPLPNGPVVLAIQRANGGTAHVKTDIRWCRPTGDGWYLSGGKFSEVVEV